MTRKVLPYLVTAGLLAAGCKGKGHATVGDILIPQASEVIEAEDGATISLRPDDETVLELPDVEVIRIAADRYVPWYRVRDIIRRVRDAGKRPVVLVGRRHYVKAFVLDDDGPRQGNAIEVAAFVDATVHVGLPRVKEVAVIGSPDKRNLMVSYVRETIRGVMKNSGYHNVEIELAETLSWANAVRVIDAARTCCGDIDMRVRIKNW